MFVNKRDPYWEPEFDAHGNCINEPKFETPDATIFLRSSLQGDFVEQEKSSFKQLTLRIPMELYADIEAIAQSGTLSRNAVMVSLLASGHALLNYRIKTDTIKRLNQISREILTNETAAQKGEEK